MSIKKNRLLEISKVKEFTSLDVKLMSKFQESGQFYVMLTFSTTPLVFFSLHNDQGCKCDILCKVGVVRIEEEGF
jgi:hypothetical protein